MTCPYRWYQFACACTFVCAVGCLFLLTGCVSSVTTPKGYTYSFNVDGQTAALIVSKQFGGKEPRRVLP
jgi:hypothetical protein